MSETLNDISVDQLNELFNLPAFENDKGHSLILIDDDVTPINYVILLLIRIFGMDAKKAVDLTMKVDSEGRAAVFTGTWEECTAKREAVEAMNATYGENLFSIIEKNE